MRIQTPFKFSKFAYFGLDTKARVGDEFLAAGIGRLYAGIYPTRTGFDLSAGILDSKGCL
jgi:hypothetical protein